MEASRKNKKEDKSALIVDAMSRCVAKYGATGATFDHVATEAGVSRGLLHYYFGTKEQLLVAVMRKHSETIAEVVRAGVEASSSLAEGVANVIRISTELIRHAPEIFMITYELLGESRRNEELGNSMADLGTAARDEIQRGLEMLAPTDSQKLRHSPRVTATVLIAIADGIAIRMLERPAEDHGPAVDVLVEMAMRQLLEDAPAKPE